MKTRSFLTIALVLGALVVVSPAQAKKTDHKHKESSQYEERQASYDGAHDDDGGNMNLRFDDSRRDAIRGYLREYERPHCPPGLAKKHNGCLPPGQAKHYRVGGFLPPDHGYVSETLLAHLGPPPAGTFYAVVDKDVLLVTEATKKILDAVTLLSAMQ